VAGCRLYLITPPALNDLAAFRETLARTLDAGDVAALQIRLKGASEDAIAGACAAILPVAQAHDVAVILNDRPDLAARFGCDGVHIGQEDGTYAQARAAVGPGRMVGVTCHDSRHLAMDAAEAGCDYVAFGAFFDTATKATTARPDLEILTDWQEIMQIPCVAIGGVTVENCAPLIAAGADFLAVSSGVWAHAEGPEAAVRAFNAAFAANKA
jgi:thiamine-phosphate pyrophosphorylase